MSLNTASSFDLQIPRGDSDAANQVASDFLTGTWFFSPTAAIATYSYDPAGNRLTTDGFAPGASNVLTTYTSGQGNRLTSAVPSSGSPITQTFDLNGNLLTKQSGSSYTTYTWDGENRLSSIAVSPSTAFPAGAIVTNIYDGAGLRQGYQDSTGRTTLTYDGQNVYRRDVQSIESVQRYTNEPGDYSPLISQADTRGGVTTHIYAVSDLSGNIRNWWSSGTRGNLDPYAYEAYGVEWITPAPEPPVSYSVPFFYEGAVGYYQDATTGLYYIKARWYDPVTGRFISEDPIGFAGGDRNLYRYVGTSPVRWSDPTGMHNPQPPPTQISTGCCGANIDGWIIGEIKNQSHYIGLYMNQPGKYVKNFFGWTNENQGYKNMLGLSTAPGCASGSCGSTVTLCGRCLTLSALGNIMFGITGSYLGYSLDEITNVANTLRIFKVECQAKTDAYGLGYSIQGNYSLLGLCVAISANLATYPKALGECYRDVSNCSPCSKGPSSAISGVAEPDGECWSGAGGPNC
jgi:RHS repeat-associated protein